MTDQDNAHRDAARLRKATALAAVLRAAGASAQMVQDAPELLDWQAAARLARTRAPSDETKAEVARVLAMLEAAHLAGCSDEDVFDRFARQDAAEGGR